MDNFHNIEQGSQEWLELRLGKVTASRIDVLLVGNGEALGVGAETYQSQLLTELLNGEVIEITTTDAMAWGTMFEPQAKAKYAFIYDHDVKEIGFVEHPTIKSSGASPDGLVDADGLVEIKCPNTANHIKTIISNEIPKQYIGQVQWQMACTGREWCDFVSFDPRLNGGIELHVIRVNRDEELIEKLEKRTTAFLMQTMEIYEKLKEKMEAA